MGVNKVTMNTPDGEQTVMDITDTSATPETVADGVVFYGADGERKTGTALGGIPVPETAAVGQTVVVTAVDENGKPTEWEPVNLPEGLPNPDDCVPGQPLVPYHTTEDGIPGGWAQQEFVPATIGEKGQLPYWTGEVDDNGIYIWEPAFVPGAAEKPEYGQTLVYRIDWDSSTNEGSWEPVTPVLSVNGQKPDEYGAVRVNTGEGALTPADLKGYAPKTYFDAAGLLGPKRDNSEPPAKVSMHAKAAYGNGVTIFIASGTSSLVRKVDGGSWEVVTPRTDNFYTDIAFGNGVFVLTVFESDYVLVSSDGLNWDEAYLSAYCMAWNILFDGTGFFLTNPVGMYGTHPYSTDGYTWVDVYPVPSMSKAVYGNGKYVGIAGDYAYICTDLFAEETFWTQVQLPHSATDLAYGDGLFVALAEGAAYAMYSMDGETWNTAVVFHDNGLQCAMESVVFGNGRFVFIAPSSFLYAGGSTTAAEIIESQAVVLMSFQWPYECDKSVSFVGDKFLFVINNLEDEEQPQLILQSYDGGYNLQRLMDDSIIPPVRTINGQEPDANGNVNVEGGGGSYSDWSEADKEAMAEYVIAKLPVYNGEVEDV